MKDNQPLPYGTKRLELGRHVFEWQRDGVQVWRVDAPDAQWRASGLIAMALHDALEELYRVRGVSDILRKAAEDEDELISALVLAQEERDEAQARIRKALEIAAGSGGEGEGAHHTAWHLDQMVRALTGCPMVTRRATDCNGTAYKYQAQGESEEYKKFVRDYEDGEDGPQTYDWYEGVIP